MHWGRHPPGRHPAPWADIPWAVHAGIHTPTQHMLGCTPLAQCMLGRTPQPPLLWMVRILLECILVTGRNKVVAKVMFLQVSVILSMGGCPAGRTPQQGDPPGKETPPWAGRTPPGRETPQAGRPPWAERPPQQGNLPRAGRPPEQGDPPSRETPRQGDPPGKETPLAGRPPWAGKPPRQGDPPAGRPPPPAYGQ